MLLIVFVVVVCVCVCGAHQQRTCTIIITQHKNTQQQHNTTIITLSASSSSSTRTHNNNHGRSVSTLWSPSISKFNEEVCGHSFSAGGEFARMYFLIMITKLPQLGEEREAPNHMRRREFCPCLFHFTCFFRKLFPVFFFPSRRANVLSSQNVAACLCEYAPSFCFIHAGSEKGQENPGACLWPAETAQRVTASADSCPEEQKQVVAAFRSRKRKKI